jgi:DNA-directed RNA polymerase specialized sigma24 family protein
MPNNDPDQYTAAIQAGDAEAFGAWLSFTEAPLRQSLQSFAHHIDTEAVLQEALLRLWQAAPQYHSDHKPNGLLRLALRIVKNAAIDECRKRRAEPAEEAALERLAEEQNPEPPDPILRKTIAGCRQKLKGKPSQVLDARLQSEGTEPDQVLAERLQMTLNTFLQNFTRARKLLLECLEKQGILLGGAR